MPYTSSLAPPGGALSSARYVPLRGNSFRLIWGKAQALTIGCDVDE
jgi:hypothetical protein